MKNDLTFDYPTSKKEKVLNKFVCECEMYYSW